MADLQITASKANRSLVNTATPDRAASLRARRIQLANPILLFYRRAIDQAVADAKRTRFGLPTDNAICARIWIQELRVDKSMPEIYFGSFDGCCEVLELDAERERARLLAEIDDVMVKAAVRFASDETYKRRAHVLTCAGLPTAIARQFVLGLVATDEHDDVAGIERPDPPARGGRGATKPRPRRLPVHTRSAGTGARPAPRS